MIVAVSCFGGSLSHAWFFFALRSGPDTLYTLDFPDVSALVASVDDYGLIMYNRLHKSMAGLY